MLDDSSHWYDRDGTACHRVPKVRGKGMTNTTIAHARKLALLPSVTAILGILEKPQLKRWQYRQITDWCYRNPAKYSEEIYFQHAVEGAFKQVKDAADAGTLIHAGIEDALMGEDWDRAKQVYLPELDAHYELCRFVDPVFEWVFDNGLKPVECERRVVNLDVGYAGTMDMAFRDKDGLPVSGDTKGLCITTPLPTPTGWTTMGEVKVGDQLIDGLGFPCTVTDKSEVHNKDCYRVMFNDGTDIVCDFDHRWKVEIGTASRIKEVVMETIQLVDYLNGPNKRASKIVRIRNVQIETPPADLPIDPYVFGAWIGDGSKRDGSISKPLDALFDEIINRGYDVGPDYSADDKCPTRTVYNIRGKLSQLGVLNNKHIPDLYKRSSVDQRLDLLRGIMDTDGCWNKLRKRCQLCTTDKVYAYDVYEIALSLGYLATVFEGTAKGFGLVKPCWSVNFTPDDEMFIAKQYRNFRTTVNKVSRQRVIRSIEKVESTPTQCVAVDSKEHTYLCGRQMIMTHNTRKTKEGRACEPYSGQPMQIAAYDVAYWKPYENYTIYDAQMDTVNMRTEAQPKRGFNLFVSTTEPGRVEVAWYTAEQLRAEYEAFCHLCEVWKFMRKYDPVEAIKRMETVK